MRAVLVLLALCAGCGGGAGLTPPAVSGPAPTTQESQCVAAGWQRLVVEAAGLRRVVLWKGPASGRWSQGAIVVMHGGGGQHANFCVANVPLIEPQVRFTAMALERGFAVFLPDSSDQVTDREGRLCGKIWDDEVRPRPSLDTPFIDTLVMFSIPALRPAGSRSEVFLTGLSSGGYMSVRAATRLGARIAAFAPVSAGDPYGWTRDCTPRAGDRANVFGIAFDNETRLQITIPGACDAAAESREQAWEQGAGTKPRWRLFHHAQDGIHDLSCAEKLRRRLQSRGYPESAPFRLDGGSRAAEWHSWLDAYNQPLLDFFAARLH